MTHTVSHFWVWEILTEHLWTKSMKEGMDMAWKRGHFHRPNGWLQTLLPTRRFCAPATAVTLSPTPQFGYQISFTGKSDGTRGREERGGRNMKGKGEVKTTPQGEGQMQPNSSPHSISHWEVLRGSKTGVHTAASSLACQWLLSHPCLASQGWLI